MKTIFFLTHVFLLSSLYGFSYYGRVVNISGKGIQNATIHVMGSQLKAISDTNGYFGDGTNSVTDLQSQSMQTPLPYIHNNYLYCWIQTPDSNVKVTLYTLQGREIFTETHFAFNTGNVSFPINISSNLSEGVYIVEVDAKGRKYAIRYTLKSSNIKSPKSLHPIGGIAKRTYPEPDEKIRLSDSLVISAQGYETTTVFVTSSNVGDVTLIAKEVNGMKLIPAKDSSFSMGTNYAGKSSEQPVHTVNFTYDFWMDTTEVTQKMFRTIAGYSTSWGPTYGVGDNYPAYFVNWFDAVLFCNARSRKEGRDTVYSYSSKGTVKPIIGKSYYVLYDVSIDLTKSGYRLPTEAEWEYACRGGSTTDYYWGVDTSIITVDQYAVFECNSFSLGSHNENYGTHEVASKKPNGFGLYDMIGNVVEYCNDWYGDNYYSVSLPTDPTGPESGTYRVRRGGNWNTKISQLYSAGRTSGKPDSKGTFIGFRTVLPKRN